MFEDLLIAAITNAIVFYAGYRWGMHQAIIRLLTNWLNNPENLNKAFEQMTKLHKDLRDENQDYIDVTAEWEGDMVYLYQKDSHEFLAQGSSVDQAMGKITLKKNVEYRIPEEMAIKPK
jgi:hypothetical protein